MFIQKLKRVRSAGKRQNTAAGREVKVLWGGISE